MTAWAWRIPCEHCGAKRPCAHYPETPGPFWKRVNLAAECIAEDTGIGSRGFDGCFEQGDGSYVVAALHLLSLSSPHLRDGIGRVWDNDKARDKFAATVASLQHLRIDQLERAAATHRKAQATRPMNCDQIALSL